MGRIESDGRKVFRALTICLALDGVENRVLFNIPTAIR
jgi:hypothetical protein